MPFMDILVKIEKLRRKLHNVASVKDMIADQEVLAASHQLDLALNEYYRLKHNPHTKI